MAKLCSVVVTGNSVSVMDSLAKRFVFTTMVDENMIDKVKDFLVRMDYCPDEVSRRMFSWLRKGD